jgi:hypothetical protein
MEDVGITGCWIFGCICMTAFLHFKGFRDSQLHSVVRKISPLSFTHTRYSYTPTQISSSISWYKHRARHRLFGPRRPVLSCALLFIHKRDTFSLPCSILADFPIPWVTIPVKGIWVFFDKLGVRTYLSSWKNTGNLETKLGGDWNLEVLFYILTLDMVIVPRGLLLG